MDKYYIRVKDTEMGEVGHIYWGAKNTEVPKGFIAYEDIHLTVSLITVAPADELREISREQYYLIEEKISEGDDPSDAIQRVLTEIGYKPDSRIGEARKLQQKFIQAAVELSEVWTDLDFYENDRSGLNEGYPFHMSFDDLVAEMQSWGEHEEVSPIEQAIRFLESEYSHKDYSHLRGDVLTDKDKVKTLVRLLTIEETRRMDEVTLEEIKRLIDNL